MRSRGGILVPVLVYEELPTRQLNRSKQHIISILAFLTYIASGILIEVTHHDVSDFFLQSSETVSSHDCGANEIHISLDKRHECVACSHVTMRVATTATRFAHDDNALEYLCPTPGYSERTLHADVHNFGSRAPPPPFA